MLSRPYDPDETSVPSPEEVYERAGAWIYRTALRVRQRMPWAEVDDLVQHGIMVALEMRERYDPARGVPFDAFVRPRVFGAMIDTLRRSGALARHDAAAFEQQEELSPSGLDMILENEDLSLLSGGIAALPEAERTALSLFYYNELTNREIAQVMRIDESRATRLRQRALTKLGQFIVHRAKPDTCDRRGQLLEEI